MTAVKPTLPAGLLTARHIGQAAVIRMKPDRIAGEITRVTHNADGTTITVRTNPPAIGWQTCCLSHGDQIELKEKP